MMATVRMARKFKTKHSILRQQLIDEWRGLKSPDSIIPHKEISNEVSTALKSFGVSNLLSEDDVVNAWNQIMPPVITENTKLTGYRNGVIEVSVLQSSIHYTLDRQMKPEIIKKLQNLFGREKVKGVIFRVG
jgi:hypothetical protein